MNMPRLPLESSPQWVFEKASVRKQFPFRFNVAFNSAEARTQAAVRGTGIVQTIDRWSPNCSPAIGCKRC